MFPTVNVTEEVMREGMQVEDEAISVDQKLSLIDAISDTGLRRIVVGSFVHPRWTPQMADIDTLVERLRPKPGVSYLALALNERGRERRRMHSPPLTIENEGSETHGHLCDVFIKRNTNRTLGQQESTWTKTVAHAKAENVTEAGIGLSAGWGSNWRGKFERDQRMAVLQAQFDLWSRAGIPVTKLFLSDPMGWNTPHELAADVVAIKDRWPSINRFRLHLHNQRGLALTSIYAAITALESRDILDVDSTLGGIGGCPYCGNGRTAGMAATEDLIQMLEEMGIETGVNLYKLVDAVWLAAEIVGRPLNGHVSTAGPFPHGDRLYPESMPMIQTHEQAQHYRLGSQTYEGLGLARPWDKEHGRELGVTSVNVGPK